MSDLIGFFSDNATIKAIANIGALLALLTLAFAILKYLYKLFANIYHNGLKDVILEIRKYNKAQFDIHVESQDALTLYVFQSIYTYVAIVSGVSFIFYVFEYSLYGLTRVVLFFTIYDAYSQMTYLKKVQARRSRIQFFSLLAEEGNESLRNRNTKSTD